MEDKIKRATENLFNREMMEKEISNFERKIKIERRTNQGMPFYMEEKLQRIRKIGMKNIGKIKSRTCK